MFGVGLLIGVGLTTFAWLVSRLVDRLGQTGRWQ